jgi:pSer/pThr/pTyr-binding forkhead associated (FHA) protein
MHVELVKKDTGERVVLPRFPALVGRESDADVRLDDPGAAPYQCMIDRARIGGVVMWDLGTGATTLVNGRPAMKAHLKPGDELTIGTTRLVVNYQASLPPLTLSPPHSSGAHTTFAH